MSLVQLVFQGLLCAPHGGNSAQISDLASEQLVVEQTTEQDTPANQTHSSFEHKISVLVLRGKNENLASISHHTQKLI